jgi:hypothetical protein
MLNVEQRAMCFIRNLEEQNPKLLLELVGDRQAFQRRLNWLVWNYSTAYRSAMKGRPKEDGPYVEESLIATILAPDQPGYDPIHPPPELTDQERKIIRDAVEDWLETLPDGYICKPE